MCAQLTPLEDNVNLYYCHYVTLALQWRGGADWDLWERRTRKVLLAKQEKGQNQAAERGSWPTDGPFRSPGGRLMTTSMALLTLQTCARTDKLPPPARELKPRELAVLYDTLADKDFVEARRALRALAAARATACRSCGRR